MSSRLGMRFGATMRQQYMRFAQRRMQSSGAAASESTAAPAKEAQQGYFAKLWNSEVGPKTVHFWAPIMKWGVVLAGASDFTRPASQLSISQNLALSATGIIWTRWCFVIRPQNLFLASVNFALGIVGVTQVARILSYQRSLAPEERAKTELGKAEKLVTEPQKIIEAAQGKEI